MTAVSTLCRLFPGRLNRPVMRCPESACGDPDGGVLTAELIHST
jgi:hypothetical protein